MNYPKTNERNFNRPRLSPDMRNKDTNAHLRAVLHNQRYESPYSDPQWTPLRALTFILFLAAIVALLVASR